MVPTNGVYITSRYYHTATSIGNGEIVVIAGGNFNIGNPTPYYSDVWVLQMISLGSGIYNYIFVLNFFKEHGVKSMPRETLIPLILNIQQHLMLLTI